MHVIFMVLIFSAFLGLAVVSYYQDSPPPMSSSAFVAMLAGRSLSYEFALIRSDLPVTNFPGTSRGTHLLHPNADYSFPIVFTTVPPGWDDGMMPPLSGLDSSPPIDKFLGDAVSLLSYLEYPLPRIW